MRTLKPSQQYIRAIIAIAVLLLNSVSASALSVSVQSIHDPVVLETIVNVLDEPPCHQAVQTSQSEKTSVEKNNSKIFSEVGSNNQSACCNDDCSHCPASITFIRNTFLNTFAFEQNSTPMFVVSSSILSGYSFPILRPPARA